MKKLLIKIYHYLKRKIFKNLKYEFEEFIPNSSGSSKDINNLIKTNINNLTPNLVNVSTFFIRVSIQSIDSLSVNNDICENLRLLFNNFGSDKATSGCRVREPSISKQQINRAARPGEGSSRHAGSKC